ncbi:MAG: hypothetical protein AAF639_02980 [Chloroflexota bacterium]
MNEQTSRPEPMVSEADADAQTDVDLHPQPESQPEAESQPHEGVPSPDMASDSTQQTEMTPEQASKNKPQEYTVDDYIQAYMERLANHAKQLYRHRPISDAALRAFWARPRHRFVKRYRRWRQEEWHEVHDDNLIEHLDAIYDDTTLILSGDDDDAVPSTISMPIFVLHMLDLLELRPGHRVFELGAGSGWNAALIGHLVSHEIRADENGDSVPADMPGEVYSIEILPEVAQQARANIEELGLENVHIIEADGGLGYPEGGPYDRAIFAAASHDLHRSFYTQIKEHGLLLIILRNRAGGDHLFILRKVDDHFESVLSSTAKFVPVTGKHGMSKLDPLVFEDLPEWKKLRHKLVARRRFWWGGADLDGYTWQTAGFGSFLSITEPWFQPFKKSTGSEVYFGLWDRVGESLVIARDNYLYIYGSRVAEERLMTNINRWVKLGMPGAANFQLNVYPVDVPVDVGTNEWLVMRQESQFLWKLCE